MHQLRPVAHHMSVSEGCCATSADGSSSSKSRVFNTCRSTEQRTCRLPALDLSAACLPESRLEFGVAQLLCPSRGRDGPYWSRLYLSDGRLYDSMWRGVCFAGVDGWCGQAPKKVGQAAKDDPPSSWNRAKGMICEMVFHGSGERRYVV